MAVLPNALKNLIKKLGPVSVTDLQHPQRGGGRVIRHLRQWQGQNFLEWDQIISMTVDHFSSGCLSNNNKLNPPVAASSTHRYRLWQSRTMFSTFKHVEVIQVKREEEE